MSVAVLIGAEKTKNKKQKNNGGDCEISRRCYVFAVMPVLSVAKCYDSPYESESDSGEGSILFAPANVLVCQEVSSLLMVTPVLADEE